MEAPPQSQPPITLPLIYFNGFQIGISNADVNLIIAHNGKPIAQISLSYTTAKTLGEQLLEAIHDLERESKHTIMSIEDVASFLSKIKPTTDKTNESNA
jgi:hypothetical protein